MHQREHGRSLWNGSFVDFTAPEHGLLVATTEEVWKRRLETKRFEDKTINGGRVVALRRSASSSKQVGTVQQEVERVDYRMRSSLDRDDQQAADVQHDAFNVECERFGRRQGHQPRDGIVTAHSGLVLILPQRDQPDKVSGHFCARCFTLGNVLVASRPSNRVESLIPERVYLVPVGPFTQLRSVNVRETEPVLYERQRYGARQARDGVDRAVRGSQESLRFVCYILSYRRKVLTVENGLHDRFITPMCGRI